MIYLDSSALLKLVLQEPQSDQLQEWLTSRRDIRSVSSELARVEVLRSCRRMAPATLPAARTLLLRLDLVPLTGAVVELASDLDGVHLRSLDALHLASALLLGDAMSTFVAYDQRLLAAAAEAGLDVVQPGG